MSTRLLGTDPTTVRGGEALAVLVRPALRVGALVGLLVTVGALLLRGPRAGGTALVVAVVVVGLHVGSGLVTARLSAGAPLAMPGITLAALVLRLAVYGGLVALFADSPLVDVPTLAVAVVSLTIAMLAVETTLVARYSRYWWQPAADDVATPSEATSSAPHRATERTDA